MTAYPISMMYLYANVSLKRKEANSQFYYLYRLLLKAQHIHTHYPSPQTKSSYTEPKNTLDALIQSQATWLVKLDQNRFYHNANRHGHLLAHLVKSHSKLKPITSLRDPDSHSIQTSTEGIFVLFNYFKDLYRAFLTDSEKLDHFLNSLALPTLSEE